MLKIQYQEQLNNFRQNNEQTQQRLSFDSMHNFVISQLTWTYNWCLELSKLNHWDIIQPENDHTRSMPAPLAAIRRIDLDSPAKIG